MPQGYVARGTGSSPPRAHRREIPRDRDPADRRLEAPAPRSSHDDHPQGRIRGPLPEPRAAPPRLPPDRQSRAGPVRWIAVARRDALRPARRDGDEVDRIAATVIGMACRVPAATRSRSSSTHASRSREPRSRAARSSRRSARRADACGLRLTDALCVGGDGWGSYLDPLHAGHPVALRTRRRARGARPRLTPTSRRAPNSPKRRTADRAAVAEAMESLAAAIALTCGKDAAPDDHRGEPTAERTPRPPALIRADALDDVPALFEEALSWDAASPRPLDAAILAWCLRRPALRDVALVQWWVGTLRRRRGARRAAAVGGGRGIPGPPRAAHVGRGRPTRRGRLDRRPGAPARGGDAEPVAYRAGALAAAPGSRGRSGGRRTPTSTPVARIEAGARTRPRRARPRHAWAPGTCRTGRSDAA